MFIVFKMKRLGLTIMYKCSEILLNHAKLEQVFFLLMLEIKSSDLTWYFHIGH